MAQRASGLAKQPAVVKTNRADGATRSAADTSADLRAIPLNLAPLLLPYKKHGRLSLRIERLHRRARLSRGRNNGDRSWSLATDELESLTYLLPEDMAEAHTLAIRIIDLDDGGGGTLAVLDFLVSPGAAGSPASDPGEDAPPRRRIGDLKKPEADLEAGKSEPSSTRSKAEPAATEIAERAVEAELALARAAWNAELDQRLSAVAAQAAAELKQSRDAGEAEQNARLAHLEECARAELAEARRGWQQQSQDAQEKAEQDWKAEAAAQLAAVEAQWQEKSASIAARDHGEAVELRALREELTALRADLEDRETALSKASADAAQAQLTWQQEHQDALAKAEKCWKADAAAQLAAAEAQWKTQSAAATARDQSSEAELRALREDLTALQLNLESREAALTQVRRDAEDAHTRQQQEIRDALANAEQNWKADAAARFAVAEAHWQEAVIEVAAEARARAALDAEEAQRTWQQEHQDALARAEQGWKADAAARLSAAASEWQENSTKALAAATAQNEQAEAALTELRVRLESELAAAREQESDAVRRLRDECASLRASLAERDGVQARLRVETDEELARRQREADAALAAAKQDWEAETTQRLSAAAAEWQENSTKALAAATAQNEQAKAALTELRARMEAELAAAREQEGDAVHRFRDECASLQASLAERDGALARLRVETDEELARRQREADAALAKAKQDWEAETTTRLSAAAAEWQENSTNALAAATARSEQAEAALAELRARMEAELAVAREQEGDAVHRLRDECASLQASLAERDGVVARLRAQTDEELARRQQEAEAALAQAAQDWEAETTQRLAAAAVQWQENSTDALAAATARSEQAEAALAELRIRTGSELAAAREQEQGAAHRLRDKCAIMQISLTDREAELAQLRVEIKEERERWQEESAAALADAQAAWEAETAARQNAAEANRRKQSARALATATERYESAEAALTQLRRAGAARGTSDELPIDRLHEDLAMLRKALADREAELEQSRFEIEELRELHAPGAESETRTVPRLAPLRKNGGAATSEPKQKQPAPSRRFGREIVVAASLAAAAVLFYPYIEPTLPYSWRSNIAAVSRDLVPVFGNSGRTTESLSSESPAAAERPMAVAVEAVNLRDGPSTQTTVITTLQSGAALAIVEQRGNWTLVQLDSENGETEPLQGWVFNTFLEFTDSGDAPPSPATQE